jgi:putative spermidine/putrescine transport system substrate-binding protein
VIMIRKLILYILTVLILMVIVGCGQQNDKQSGVSLLATDWKDISSLADGQMVNLYMWGGSDSINRYIDEWVTPRLKEQTGVVLRRVPMVDTKDILTKLISEKQVNQEKGSIDIMWINGENFKFAKDNELLWGSFTKKLPNMSAYYDVDAPDIAYDFGQATEGMEAPWGKAQFVFIYDSAHIPNPPTSMKALEQWVKDNPGKFTYPAPPDFTGSAFIRHVLYETTGGYESYLVPYDSDLFTSEVKPLWDYLKNIEPYLWRKGETYPEYLGKLDLLYSSGEIWMTMGYDPARASNEIKNGVFPSTTRTFVLDEGTLSNTHYLTIPFNSTKAAGAMAAINFMLSPDAQITKFDPAYWGEDMALNPAKLTAKELERVTLIDRGEATLSADHLATHRVPEIASDYIQALEKGWTQHVAKQ